MKILALDLGTTMGFATPETTGTVEFKNSRHEGGGMRYLRLKLWLNEMYKLMGGINVLFYEEVAAHKGTTAAHTYGGFLSMFGPKEKTEKSVRVVAGDEVNEFSVRIEKLEKQENDNNKINN